MKKEDLRKCVKKLNTLDLIEYRIEQLIKENAKVAIILDGYINNTFEISSENAMINSRIKSALLNELISMKADIEQDIENL